MKKLVSIVLTVVCMMAFALTLTAADTKAPVKPADNKTAAPAPKK